MKLKLHHVNPSTGDVARMQACNRVVPRLERAAEARPVLERARGHAGDRPPRRRPGIRPFGPEPVRRTASETGLTPRNRARSLPPCSAVQIEAHPALARRDDVVKTTALGTAPLPSRTFWLSSRFAGNGDIETNPDTSGMRFARVQIPPLR